MPDEAARGVLFLTLNSSLGGTEKYLLSLCQSLDRRKFRPTLVTLIGDGSVQKIARAGGIECFHLGMRGVLDLRVVFRLWDLMRERRFSVLHTAIYHTGILGRILGRMARIPAIVWSARSTDDWRKPWHSALDCWTQGWVHCYLANCQAVADRLVRVERIAPGKIRVLRSAIEPVRRVSEQEIADLRRGLELRTDQFIVGTIANFRPAKGHAILLDAAKQIVAQVPKVVFIWVGDGPLRSSLERQIAGAGLQRHFRLAGFQMDPAPYYALSNMIVLPSLWEGVPLSLLEAMGLGLPIVATCVGGVEEIIEDGKEGQLVCAGDAGSLARAILDMVNTGEDRKAMGSRAKARFDKENSLECHVAEVQDLYEEMGSDPIS